MLLELAPGGLQFISNYWWIHRPFQVEVLAKQLREAISFGQAQEGRSTALLYRSDGSFGFCLNWHRIAYMNQNDLHQSYHPNSVPIILIYINHIIGLYQSYWYTSTTSSSFSVSIIWMYLLNCFCSHFHPFLFWLGVLQGVQGQRPAAASAKLWNSHAWEWDHSGRTFIHGFRRVENTSWDRL